MSSAVISAAKVLLASPSNADTAAAVASALVDALVERHGPNVLRDRARALGLTLKRDNPQLVEQLLSGSLSPAVVANADPHQLSTAAQSAQDTRTEASNVNAATMDAERMPVLDGSADSEGGVLAERVEDGLETTREPKSPSGIALMR